MPDRRLLLSQEMLQNLEKLQLPIEELRQKIEEELERQHDEDGKKDPDPE